MSTTMPGAARALDVRLIERLLREAHADCAARYGRVGAAWWPRRGLVGQGQATSWCWALVIRIGMWLDDGQAPLDLAVPWHGLTHQPFRRHLVDQLWRNPRRTHSACEVLVDYTITNYATRGNPLVLSAESEMYAGHGCGPGMGDANGGRVDDYTWDFYKLLLVKSPRRLFVARVGAVGAGKDEDGASRVAALRRSLDELMSWYGSGLVGEDELVIVLMEEDPRIAWHGVWLGEWTGSVIRWTQPAGAGPAGG